VALPGRSSLSLKHGQVAQHSIDKDGNAQPEDFAVYFFVNWLLHRLRVSVLAVVGGSDHRDEMQL
jgi:hypothetical protein